MSTSKRPSRACKARGYNNKTHIESPMGWPTCSPHHNQNSKSNNAKMVTPQVTSSQLSVRKIRNMWQLASILNFLNVFRPILKINVEFSAEELETALITPNNTLADIHMPLLRLIPPNVRAAIGYDIWITTLCRKLRHWWYSVAEGELPIVASHGAEVEAYYALDPEVRVMILKAICDVRVEQGDIRKYIDKTIKAGVRLSNFCKERVGGDSFGISYWYEDDPEIGYRLYRETRKVETEKEMGKNIQPIPASSYQWETIATNFDEFQDVSEKLFQSTNRTEVSLGKKLKTDMLPVIEKVHKNKEKLVFIQRKKKEKLLKKQHRDALLLDNSIKMDGTGSGRSRRDRKHVTYTFDDYDRSINDAIKKTKQNQSSPQPTIGNEIPSKPSATVTVRWTRSAQAPPQASLDAPSPNFFHCDDTSMDHKPDLFVCSNRQRQEPPRYTTREFVEAASDCRDDASGDVICDDKYSREKKQKRKSLSSSEEDGLVHSSSMNGGSDGQLRFKNLGVDMRESKSRSVDELQCLRLGDKPTCLRISFKTTFQN